MVKEDFPRLAFILYLVVSGHILVECRRAHMGGTSLVDNQGMKSEGEYSLETASESQTEMDHPRCGFRQGVQSYHFEVEESDNHCEDGLCMAIELVSLGWRLSNIWTSKESPKLKIHQGQAWRVSQAQGSKSIEWGLYQVAEADWPDRHGLAADSKSKSQHHVAMSYTVHLPNGTNFIMAGDSVDAVPEVEPAFPEETIEEMQGGKPLEPGEVAQQKEMVIDLYDVEVIRLFDALSSNSVKLADKLEITLACQKDTGCGKGGVFHERDVFALEGGLYYDEFILAQGFKKMEEITGDHFQQMLQNASQPTRTVTGQKKGQWIGGSGGALIVGGYYTAATLTGVAVETQALISAAVLGVVGGTIGGFLVGGVVGAAAGMYAASRGYATIKGYEITSAGRKIYEELRCMSEFKECGFNILVPKNKECPRDGYRGTMVRW